MRRLTLILSDLYLPREASSGDVPRPQELPALERWLRFSDRAQPVSDWRQWLARDLGVHSIAQWPVAHVRALAAGIVEPRGVWLATPVRLEARLDHVRLANHGLLRLPPEQGIELGQEFGTTFGPEHHLSLNDERALLLSGGPDDDLRTVDPARLLDADIGPALPSGPAAGMLRRLGAEIEMWLPGTRTNAARQRAGLPEITALWLWGGGKSALAPADATSSRGGFELYGGDPFVAALCALLTKQTVRSAPGSLDGLGTISDTYVELSPMSGSVGDSLPLLDADWLAPALDALREDRLDSLRLVTNDRVFRMTPRAHWKVWRRRRDWLGALKA
jgi:hypothetical protein